MLSLLPDSLVALVDSLRQNAMMDVHEFHQNGESSDLSEEVLDLF